MIAKFVVFTLVAAACVECLPQLRFGKFLGNVVHDSLSKYRYVGSAQAMRQTALINPNKVMITFPEYLHSPPNEDFIIEAIEQVDHGKQQAQVEIIEGGIGWNQVKMLVTVPEGVEGATEFHFFGGKRLSLEEEMEQKRMNSFIFPETDQNTFAKQVKPTDKLAFGKTLDRSW